MEDKNEYKPLNEWLTPRRRFDRFWAFCYRALGKIKYWTTPFHIKREIKWKFQIKTRGFSDLELWNLDTEFALFIYPRLVAFKEMPRMGYPHGTTPEEWEKIQDKVIRAFDLIANKDWGLVERPDNKDLEKYRENAKKTDREIEEGLDLFAKYFGAYWD